MIGTIPTEAEGAQNRTACKSSINNDCAKQYPIKVQNCGEFRVYYLVQTTGCSESYCFGELTKLLQFQMLLIAVYTKYAVGFRFIWIARCCGIKRYRFCGIKMYRCCSIKRYTSLRGARRLIQMHFVIYFRVRALLGTQFVSSKRTSLLVACLWGRCLLVLSHYTCIRFPWYSYQQGLPWPSLC